MFEPLLDAAIRPHDPSFIVLMHAGTALIGATMSAKLSGAVNQTKQ